MKAQEPPALEVTDKELIAAVEKGCRILSAPAVPTSNIAEFDDITIHQQTVKNRLEALSDANEIGGMQVGRGYIWWVPEGETKGGTVDDTTLSGDFIDWKRIDGSDIPPDILTSAIQELDYEEVTESVKSHPDHKEETRWDKFVRQSDAILKGAFLAFLLGACIFLLEDSRWGSSISRAWLDLGLFSLVASIFFMAIGFAFYLTGKGGEVLSKYGVFRRLTEFSSWIIEKCKSKIPISISFQKKE